MLLCYEIPLSPEPQQFTIALGAYTVILRFAWCQPMQCWIVDFMDADQNPVLMGTPVLTGQDLLGQYEHLGLQGSLIVQTDHDPDAVPTFDNLGGPGRVYFVVEK